MADVVVIEKDELKKLIHEALSSNGNGSHPEKWFFTSKEAGQLLGLPRTWLETKAKEGEIKRIQFGHYKVFAREELMRFAEEYRKKQGDGA